jgi:hypothetical protein
MISTPSYPAWRASAAQWAKSASCFSMPASSSACGVKGAMRDLTAEGATHAGLGASAPMCRICMQIFTSASAAWTAPVISRC